MLGFFGAVLIIGLLGFMDRLAFLVGWDYDYRTPENLTYSAIWDQEITILPLYFFVLVSYKSEIPPKNVMYNYAIPKKIVQVRNWLSKLTIHSIPNNWWALESNIIKIYFQKLMGLGKRVFFQLQTMDILGIWRFYCWGEDETKKDK